MYKINEIITANENHICFIHYRPSAKIYEEQNFLSNVFIINTGMYFEVKGACDKNTSSANAHANVLMYVNPGLN